MAVGTICLISVITTFIVANVVKAAIKLVQGSKDYHGLIASGGMPSVHTASVAALAITIGLGEGFNSAIFALAFVFLMIVVYDGTHVRRAAGEQGEALNKVLPKNSKRPFNSYGHKFVEAFAGGVLGILVGAIIFFTLQ